MPGTVLSTLFVVSWNPYNDSVNYLLLLTQFMDEDIGTEQCF
jgi:hypothetical protein